MQTEIELPFDCGDRVTEQIGDTEKVLLDSKTAKSVIATISQLSAADFNALHFR